MNQIWLAFLTGITTGGISCLAVQGGLITSAIAQQKDASVSKQKIIGLFLLSKIIAYMVLGFVLGLVGSVLVLSPKVLGFLQIATGIYMILVVLNLLNVHPIFRFVVIQPPSWVYKMLRSQAKGSSALSPVIMGAFTILMPCGVTQAMMLGAVSSGNPFVAAALLGAFTLGTSPLFFILGAALVQMLKRPAFMYAAASVVLLFALMTINGGLTLTGSLFTLQNFYAAAITDVTIPASSGQTLAAVNDQGEQEALITVSSHGYSSSVKKLKVGQPVKLTLVTNQTVGCARAFTIPDLNISKILPESGTEVVTFTPTKTGTLRYTCGMGMYSNSFEVI